MLNVVSAKLTGAPGSAGWAQVYEFDPSETEKLSSRGKLYVIIATTQLEQGVDMIASGREILSRINEEYFGNLEAKPFYALKSAIQKVADEFTKSWGGVEMAALSLVGDTVYVAAYGGSKVLISREGALATLLESREGIVAAASGYPKEADVILLASQSFFKKVPVGVVKAALAGSTPEEGMETLAPIVHGEDGMGNLCAEILRFESQPKVQTYSGFQTLPTVNKPVKFDIIQKLEVLIGKIGERLPKRTIYIKSAITEEVSPRSKKSTFSIALILLFLLGASIVFGVKQKRINDLKSRYQGILQESLSQVDQAISLASVSPDRSRELFADAQAKLGQIENMKVKDPAIETLRQKINDGRSSILGEYTISPEMFLDLTLLSSGFKGDKISFSNGQVYILDSSGSRVLGVGVSTKKSRVVAGPGVINSATGLAGYESKVFVLQPEGIYEVGSGNVKVVEKTWSGEALISAFAGNMYVVDKSGQAIYRYQGSGSSFGSKQSWLAAGTNVNFSDATQVAIDGAVYVLYPNSKISKFSQGSPQSFRVRGVIPEIGSIDAISAGPDNQYIYLLDRAGKRVVVTDKTGSYKAQYVNDQIGSATNLVVSEQDKKIILLTGDKLYSLEIKHI